tara:strand:- start:2405 stop:3430 length:1026 start_codon:yes stop_codon:yes gene_type:complete
MHSITLEKEQLILDTDPENPENTESKQEIDLSAIQYVFESSLERFNDQQTIKETIKFEQIKSDLINKVTGEITKTFQKNEENSTIKGSIAEKKLGEILMRMYPKCEVEDQSNNPASCDFSVKFDDSTIILVECKAYQRNVPKVEIDKFVRDSLLREQSAVMFSMESGIANRDNWEINIIDPSKGIAVLYVHNVNYDTHMISASIDLLKNLTKLHRNMHLNNKDKDNAPDNCIIITPELLHNITTEYKDFNEKIIKTKKIIKDFSTGIINQLDTYKLPNVEQLLTQTGQLATKPKRSFQNISQDSPEPDDSQKFEISFKCDHCENIYKSKKSLNAHKKAKHS